MISPLPIKKGRFTRAGFPLCSGCLPRSQAGLCPCTFRVISIHPKPTLCTPPLLFRRQMPHLNCPGGTFSRKTHPSLFIETCKLSMDKNCNFQWRVFHWRLQQARRPAFIASPLRYAPEITIQYHPAVKLPGSFRLAAAKAHVHAYCIFTGQLGETVPQWLSLSCRPELQIDYSFSNTQPLVKANKQAKRVLLAGVLWKLPFFKGRFHPGENPQKSLRVP